MGGGLRGGWGFVSKEERPLKVKKMKANVYGMAWEGKRLAAACYHCAPSVLKRS